MRTIVQSEADVTTGNGPRVGDLLGAYRLTALLGEGGMAKVFAAEHVSAGHRVALKVLGKERSASASAARSFAFEALAAQRIGHPNVVDILTSGEDSDHKFHVMEHVNGVSVRDLMEAPAPMSVPRVMAIARELASALAAAHRAGIVHRDLKPENVMVDENDGRVGVKLIDFGAAKDLNAPSVVGESIVGTPIYMAPEQMWGQPTTATTDVYAFGLLVYEMLADRLPFRSRKFVELREERSTQEPTPLRVSLVERLRAARARVGGPAPILRESVPAELEALIMTCLARSPDERPSSMGTVLSRLMAFDGAGRNVRRPTTRESHVAVTVTPRRPTRPGRRLRHAVGYTAAVLAIVASASTLMSDTHARPRDGAILVASR